MPSGAYRLGFAVLFLSRCNVAFWFSASCLFPVRWRRSRARCCEECGARPPARAELSAEGGGLKSKRLRPASGSWTLLDDSNRIALEGTWSARRVNAPAKLTVPHWQG